MSPPVLISDETHLVGNQDRISYFTGMVFLTTIEYCGSQNHGNAPCQSKKPSMRGAPTTKMVANWAYHSVPNHPNLSCAL